MVKSIEVRNVNEALGVAIEYLLDEEGENRTSRNGKVLVAPVPVCTTYTQPQERVLFNETRDANPFFHLMESLWMLAGNNDLQWPVKFNQRFAEYSDDGKTIHGAYGFRWKEFFMFDQIKAIVEHLKFNPDSRRAVLTMWSPEGDLTEHTLRAGALGYAGTGGLSSKDVPCNTHAYFSLNGDYLDMTVCNRSNDVIWGAYGANVVHFSFLQEYIAASLGVKMGVYHQFSNNFHIYPEIYGDDVLRKMAEESHWDTTPYHESSMTPIIELVSTYQDMRDWDEDLVAFMSRNKDHKYRHAFFSHVAEPMYLTWEVRKAEGNEKGLQVLRDTMTNCDWKIACDKWIQRRIK